MTVNFEHIREELNKLEALQKQAAVFHTLAKIYEEAFPYLKKNGQMLLDAVIKDAYESVK